MTNLKQFCPRGHDTFLIGRDSSHRCLACKRQAMQAAARAREAEEAAIRHAEREAMRAEELRQQKAERARIMAAGGPAAKEMRWNERWVRTLQATESSYSLCQWPQSNDRPGGCFQRTAEVYCRKHNDQLEREAAEWRRLKVTK